MGLCDMPTAFCVRDTCLACILGVCVTLAFGRGTGDAGRPLNYSLCNCRAISPELVGTDSIHQPRGMWAGKEEGTIPGSECQAFPSLILS